MNKKMCLVDIFQNLTFGENLCNDRKPKTFMIYN